MIKMQTEALEAAAKHRSFIAGSGFSTINGRKTLR